MKEFFDGLWSSDAAIKAAVITALVTLIVSIVTSVINMISNLRVNKKRILSEEKRVIPPYFDILIRELKGALIELNECRPKSAKTYKETMENIMESNKKSMDILRNVSPYLMKDDRKKLLDRYKLICKMDSELQCKCIPGIYDKKKYNPDEKDIDKLSKIQKEMINLKSDFNEVLTNELTRIMDILQETAKIN